MTILQFAGYTVYEKLLRVPKGKGGGISSLRSCALNTKTSQSVRNTWTTNKSAGGNPPSRVQATLPVTNKHIQALKKALASHGEMEGRHLSEAHVMFSKKGSKEQDFHYDYNPDKLKNVPTMPRLVLLALQDATQILLYDDAQDKIVTVELRYGDCLVFDANMIHAGAAFARDNVRIHCYLDVPCASDIRDAGKIWPLSAEQNADLKKKDRVNHLTLPIARRSTPAMATTAELLEHHKETVASLVTANKQIGDEIAKINQNIAAWKRAICTAEQKLVPLEKKRKRMHVQMDAHNQEMDKKIRHMQEVCKQLQDEALKLKIENRTSVTL